MTFLAQSLPADQSRRSRGMTDMVDTKLRHQYRLKFGEPWPGTREQLDAIWRIYRAKGNFTDQRHSSTVDHMRRIATAPDASAVRHAEV